MFPRTLVRWIPSVLCTSLTDIQGMAGTDATVFLYFLHMIRWCLTAISVVVCVILLPVDLSYNIAHHNDTKPNTNDESNASPSKNYILYLTMSHQDLVLS